MKLVVQRVDFASVKRKDTSEAVGQIKKGLFVLFCAEKGDTDQTVELMSKKLSKLRVLSDDESGKMNRSVLDLNQEILLVSQFTLAGDLSEGNRPSFLKAAEPEVALKMYKDMVAQLKDMGIKVETGSFGNYMEISLSLDGPVTIIINS
jgi:D-aminoacyl-tRNA deacylase